MSGALPKYWVPGAAPSYQAASAGPEQLRPTAQQRLSIRALEARVRRYNSDIRTDSPTFRAAVLLLAAVEYGQNIDLLARRTGYDRAFVAKCGRRLIDNGVWVGGSTVSEWSPEDEASGAFWNDVAVAEGKLCRRVGPDGHIEWAPAGYWNKSYDFVGASRENELSTVYRDPAGPHGVAEEASEVEAGPEPEAQAPVASEGEAVQDSEPAGGPPPAGEEGKRPPGPTELFPDAVWLG